MGFWFWHQCYNNGLRLRRAQIAVVLQVADQSTNNSQGPATSDLSINYRDILHLTQQYMQADFLHLKSVSYGHAINHAHCVSFMLAAGMCSAQ